MLMLKETVLLERGNKDLYKIIITLARPRVMCCFTNTFFKRMQPYPEFEQITLSEKELARNNKHVAT